MKKLMIVGAAALVAWSAFAEVRIVAPEKGAVVPLLTSAQKAYLTLPRAERREKFADGHFRDKEMGRPAEVVAGGRHDRETYWPKTVRLVWDSTKDGVECHLVVKSVKTGACVWDAQVKGGVANVDNLEIATEYEWTVSDGEGSASSRFVTEDMAPRLIRYPGVPNVRDLGGRIGLNGKRVRQGMVIRSAGLNDNAGHSYYTREELEKAGKLPELEKQIAETEKRLAQLKGWQKDPKTMDREDGEYKDWCTRHKNDPVTKFLSSRIDRARHKLKHKDFRIQKGMAKGRSRVEGENGEYIRSRFGIKSDIDLRSDGECWGMEGSPLGDSVTWFHISSGAYGGMQDEFGRKAFTEVFKVFLDRKNYPIDFHCIAGQDRTGAVAFIVNALLGVEEEQLYLDWETTGFWNRSTWFRHESLFDHLVRGFEKNYPDAPTMREKVERYVLSLGFTREDIETLRGIMLEDYGK